MKEIFISYSTVDMAQAETVRNVLETNGLSCWMAPRDIPGGSNYTKEIPIAIRNCKVFVLILSKNAQGSHWVLKELDSAVNAGKVILPFMLEDCTLNDEFNFLLTGAQRYAAYQKTAEAMETLIGRIRGILDSDQKEPAIPAQPSGQERTAAPKVDPISIVLPGQAVCPACGAGDPKILPHKIKRQGKEIVTLLLIPVMALILGFIGLIFASIAMDYSLIGWFWLSFTVIGGVLGEYISRTAVRRKRLRNRIRATCYRCSTCSKVFLHEEELKV